LSVLSEILNMRTLNQANKDRHYYFRETHNNVNFTDS